MLSPNAASLVISVTRGLVKLGGRMDLLLAEKEATTGVLAIPMPAVVMPKVSRATKVERLQDYLAATATDTPDPLHPDREMVTALVAKAEDLDGIDAVFGRVFPGEEIEQVIDPDAEFLGALRARLPTLDLSHPDVRLACFYCAAGRDERQITYPARIALLVTDVLGEFAAENASLVVRDEGARAIVQSVVERFARPELETFTAWSPLLRHALGATVEGLLANREALGSAAPWVDAVLAALAIARAETADGEDFVTGLVRGKGYSALLAGGLLVAGERLSAESASSYKQIAAEVLRTAAPLVKAGSEGFNAFFQDNWGELLRAGLTAVERYGPVLLEGKKPIVRDATLALVRQLARTPNASLFGAETLHGLANSVIGTGATRPELMDAGIREAWVKDLVGALAKMAADKGLQRSLTRDGLRDAFRSAAAVLGRHPELLSDRPADRVAMIGAVLQSVSAAGTLDAKTLATRALAAILGRVGEQPQLLDSRYADILSAFAGQAAKLVATGALSGAQAADLIDAAADAVLRNPDLFAKLEGKVATAVLDGVLKGSEAGSLKVLGGALLVDLLGETLRMVALRGRDLVEGTTEKALVARVADVVTAGLARADQELGRRLDVTCMPLVLAGLVAAVARGEITVIDPADAKFEQAFALLAEAAIAVINLRETGR
jgi:hypothetical protein